MRHLAKLPAEAQDHSQALSVRCGDYAGLAQGDKAEQAADQMLRSADLVEADVTSALQPNNGSIHFFWGIVCIEQILAEGAYQALKKAATLDPNNPYYNYAIQPFAPPMG
jgi:hypothetical protein